MELSKLLARDERDEQGRGDRSDTAKNKDNGADSRGAVTRAEFDAANQARLTAEAGRDQAASQVQKARKGRRLTRHMQDKILEALNAFSAPESYQSRDLFNYSGKKDLNS